MDSNNKLFQKQRHALIICDLQYDLIKSLPPASAKTLKTAIHVALQCVRLKQKQQLGKNTKDSDWTIIYTGLKFDSGYRQVPSEHKLYGPMKRLNAKLGDGAVHWFMDGFDGTNIISKTGTDDNETAMMNQNDIILWRDRHLPSSDLQSTLEQYNITNAYVCGIKSSTAVQSTVQLLCDLGISTSVIREGVADDNPDRHEAILKYLIPTFADVISLGDMVEDVIGMDQISEDCRQALIEVISSSSSSTQVSQNNPTITAEKAPSRTKIIKLNSNKKNEANPTTTETTESQNDIKYCTDCGRGGHGQRYIQFLLERSNEKWCTYPSQPWYENFHGSYECPLAKKVVDFCDEPQFSKVSMYLQGREWLDEKDHVIDIAGKYMPTSYTWEPSSQQWKDGKAPPSDTEETFPWFIKEADKNLGGPFIGICSKASEIKNFMKLDRRYVVQQHVKDPLLTDGKKTHIKFYALLICDEDENNWTLYTYKNAKLSISPNKWSVNDLSQDTQITIHRHPIPPEETPGWKEDWPRTYEKCKSGTAEVIKTAIRNGKLKGRKGKKQFEVFSADWMPDEHGKMYLFEFNMSPAVCQKEFDDATERDERRDKLMRADETMLRDALSIVFPYEGCEGTGLWDKVEEF